MDQLQPTPETSVPFVLRAQYDKAGENRRFCGATLGLQKIWWGISLLAGLAGVIGGLRSLAVRPVDGVLAVIGGMAAILYAANGFNQGPGVF